MVTGGCVSGHRRPADLSSSRINAVRNWAGIVKGEERLVNESESSRADWNRVKDWTGFRSMCEDTHSNPGIRHRSSSSTDSKGERTNSINEALGQPIVAIVDYAKRVTSVRTYPWTMRADSDSRTAVVVHHFDWLALLRRLLRAARPPLSE